MQDVDQLRNQEQKVFPLKHSAASERAGRRVDRADQRTPKCPNNTVCVSDSKDADVNALM